MQRIPLAAFTAVLLLSVGTARASHYPLNSIDVTTAEENFALFKADVDDTEKLLAQAGKRASRAALARKTGIPEERLKVLAELCDLLSMKGVGPIVARLLTRCEVRTLNALGKAQVEPLAACMKQVNLKESITELLPPREFLSEWIEQARRAESVVE
jgi:hypothetical protein